MADKQAKKYRVIGVGSPVVDTLAQVPESFLSGVEGAKGGMELVNAEQMGALMARLDAELVEAPGGSAGNTTFGLARLGMPVTMLGKLGNDATAAFYRESLEKLGGDGSRFKNGVVPNARCLSLVTPDSQRTMRTDLGAAMTLTPEEVTEADFADCDHAHIEGYLLFNENLLRKALDCAKANGCTVSIDLASFEVVNAAKPILPELLEKYVDIVFANEEEAAAYHGEGKSPEEWARGFAESVEVAAVKLGAKGSVLARGDELVRVEPILAENLVDTTGAGDLWATGFLYGYLSGRSLADCGRYGSITGAEVVQIMGAYIADDRWQVIKSQLA